MSTFPPDPTVDQLAQDMERSFQQQTQHIEAHFDRVGKELNIHTIRLTELRSRAATTDTRLGTIDLRLNGIDTRLEHLEDELVSANAKLEQILALLSK